MAKVHFLTYDYLLSVFHPLRCLLYIAHLCLFQPSNLLQSRRTGIVWCLPILLSYLHLVIYFRFKLSFIILLFAWIWISWPPLPSLLPCRSSRSPPSSRAGKPWTRTRTRSKEKPQNQKQEQEQKQKRNFNIKS